MRAPGWASTILLTLVISTSTSLAVQWASDTGRLASLWQPQPATAAPEEPDTPVGRSVPQLIGLPRKIAAELLEPRQLLLVVREEREDPDLPKGAVLSQDPLPGSDLAPGGQVSVVLSAGLTERIEVPDLAGKGLAAAKAALEEAGLTVGDIQGPEAPAEGEDTRVVVSSTPSAGEQALAEAEVSLEVKAGVVEVPKVIGLNVPKARKAIEEAGLKVGSIRTRFDDMRPVWMVLSQKPNPGDEVAPGSEVTIIRNEP